MGVSSGNAPVPGHAGPPEERSGLGYLRWVVTQPGGSGSADGGSCVGEDLPELERSALLLPIQLLFQFPDPCLGNHAGFLLNGGAGFSTLRPGPFLPEGGDVLSRFRVVPTQLSVVPPDEEVEHRAEALQDPLPRRSRWGSDHTRRQPVGPRRGGSSATPLSRRTASTPGC